MATILDLSASKRQRTGTGAMGRLRKEGSIPAILYGRTHASTTLKVDGKTFNKIVGIEVGLRIGSSVTANWVTPSSKARKRKLAFLSHCTKTVPVSFSTR